MKGPFSYYQKKLPDLKKDQGGRWFNKLILSCLFLQKSQPECTQTNQ